MMKTKKKKYLKIKMEKQSTLRLYKVKSNINIPKKEYFNNIRLPSKPQQRTQSINANSQTRISQPSASVADKKRRSLSNGRPLLQTNFRNARRFITSGKIQTFE